MMVVGMNTLESWITQQMVKHLNLILSLGSSVQRRLLLLLGVSEESLHDQANPLQSIEQESVLHAEIEQLSLKSRAEEVERFERSVAGFIVEKALYGILNDSIIAEYSNINLDPLLESTKHFTSSPHRIESKPYLDVTIPLMAMVRIVAQHFFFCVFVF